MNKVCDCISAMTSSSAKVAVADERDVHGISGDIKQDLLNNLDNIARSGNCATLKSFSKLSVDPKIRLLKYEDQEEIAIGFPLGLQGARVLSIVYRAPFDMFRLGYCVLLVNNKIARRALHRLPIAQRIPERP